MSFPKNHPIRGRMPLPHKSINKYWEEMDNNQFKQLLRFFNRSWKGYRKVRKGVKKRITRHMQTVGCQKVEAYLHLLNTDEAVRGTCERLLTVSISRFFRDRHVWKILGEKILPDIAARKSTRVRVWSAGCARGEEAYSLRMAWEELTRRNGDLPRLDVTATDVNAEYLAQAREGVYTRSSVRELSEQQKAWYFEKKKDGRQWRIRPELKTGIAWVCRDLTAENPLDETFDIVCLRNNLLTYYKDPEKSTAFKRITASLAPGGIIIIGAHEQLPENADHLTPVTGSRLIFRHRA